MAMSFLANAIDFRLEVTNIKELLNALKEKKEEIKNSTEKTDLKHIKKIDYCLELYEKNYEKVYIEQAQHMYLLINDLLKHKYDDYSNCARCDGDKNQKNIIEDDVEEALRRR